MIKLVVDDLFERIKCSSVRKEPFPHLVVDDFLPQNFYKQLARQLDSDDFSSRYQKGLYGGENRYCVDLTDFVAWQNSGCRLSTAIHEKNYKKHKLYFAINHYRADLIILEISITVCSV